MEEEKTDDRGKGERVHRLDAEEQAAKILRKAEGSGYTEDRAQEYEENSLFDDKANNIMLLGAERHADADLAGAAAHFERRARSNT